MEFKSVSKNCVKEWFILRGIFFVLFAAGFAGMFFIPAKTDAEEIAKVLFLIFAGMVLLLQGAFAFVLPVMQYNRLRYRITDSQIETRRGVVFLRSSYVPFVRIQHVVVFRGIFDRLFGMSTVIIYTAGSAVRLPNLDIQQAEDAVAQIRSLLAQEGGDND